MALRNIIKEDDPILRKISKPVEKVDNKIKILIDDMLETLKNEDGVGLAAPQVGVLKRIFVIDVGEGPIVFVNPKILKQEGERICVEGCLSVPGIFGEVKRPVKVKFEGLDKEGNPLVLEAEELLANVLCHEFDHLNGILFKDKVINYIDVSKEEKKSIRRKNK